MIIGKTNNIAKLDSGPQTMYCLLYSLCEIRAKRKQINRKTKTIEK